MAISLNKLKFLSSLKEKKIREQENLFLIEGEKIILEAVNSDWVIDELFFTHGFALEHQSFLSVVSQKQILINFLSTKEYEKISNEKTAPECAALIRKKEFDLSDELKNIKKSKFIILERINDPGNLGTIIRTADWFGFHKIILSRESCEVWNHKVIKASMGSVFHCSFFENIDLIDTLPVLKNAGLRMIAADLNGKDIKELDTNNGYAIIFGNESHGISKELLNNCNEIITISRKGKAESLNVAISASIILYLLSN